VHNCNECTAEFRVTSLSIIDFSSSSNSEKGDTIRVLL